MTHTYWFNSPRGFANEFTVGVATTQSSRNSFKTRGFKRIKRDRALRELRYRGDAATQAYVSAEVDNYSADPRELAQAIVSGLPLDTCTDGFGSIEEQEDAERAMNEAAHKKFEEEDAALNARYLHLDSR